MSKKPGRNNLLYIGPLVLGLSDALIEMIGVLTGLTFALQNPRLIASVGFITGMAAALSMAASEFLSIREEEARNPARSGILTGVAYIIVVVFLISPFLILPVATTGLMFSLIFAFLIVVSFNIYIAKEKNVPFMGRFIQMLVISFGVAFLSYIVGTVVNGMFGI